MGEEGTNLQVAFDLINQAVAFSGAPNASYTIVGTLPKAGDDLVATLKTGISYSVKAVASSAFTGEVNFLIKGNILET